MENYVKLSALGLYVISVVQLFKAWQTWRGKSGHCECSHRLSSSPGKNALLYSLFLFPLALGFMLPDSILGSALAAKKGVNLTTSGQSAALNGQTSTISPAAADESSSTDESSSAPSSSAAAENQVTAEPGETNENDLQELFPHDEFTEIFAKHGMELYAQETIEVKEELFTETLTTLDLYLDNFVGKNIEISGFVYREEGMGENQFAVSRFVVQCCSADAAPYGVMAEYFRANQLADDTWIKVRGTLDKTNYNGYEIMKINVTRVEFIEAPEQPYVYPNFAFGYE
jgi:uncharacterized repeat protein (TIGR03943 family)